MVSNSAAETYQDLSLLCENAYYRFGGTGTNFRADGRDMLLHAILSQTLFRMTVADLVAVGRLAPARVAMLRVRSPVVEAGSWGAYKVGIVSHDHRNAVLAYAANTLAWMGRRVLVLVKEIEHAERLAALIPGAAQVDGRDNSVLRGVLTWLSEAPGRVVVGTSVIGEGVDVPAADALVYATGGRSRVKVPQDYFRVLTACPGKDQGIVVDIADMHHPELLEASVDRLAIYRSEGCFTSDVMDPDQFGAWLADLR